MPTTPAPARPAPARRRLIAAPAGRRGRLAVAVAVAAVVMAPMSAVHADERSDAEDQQFSAQQKEQELTASLEGVSSELGQAYLDLQKAKQSLSTAEDALSEAESTLATKEREQQTASDQLDVAQADLDELTKDAESTKKTADETESSVGELVVSTHQGDNSLTSWSYVLSSDDVEELTDRADTMEIASGVQESALQVAETERAQAANRKARQDATTERVATLKEKADEAEKAAQEAKDDAQTKRDEVASLKKEKEEAAKTLENQKGDLEEQLKQASADEAAAAAKIAEIDARNQASSAYTGTSGSVDASSLGSGAIGHPITGTLTVASPYGYRIHPITGVRRLHAGVDLVAAEGQPQYAAVSGTVTYNQNSSCGSGLFIDGGVINGQSVVLAYCHLSAYSVADGATVSKGDQIGLTGHTGGATGPHCHFEVHINGQTIDPMTLPGF